MAAIEGDSGLPFIEELHVAGYGCVTDASFRLTRLHAFVGPNDSGKSTLLRAIETLLTVATAPHPEAYHRLMGDPRLPTEGSARLGFRLSGQTFSYQLERAGGRVEESLPGLDPPLPVQDLSNGAPLLQRVRSGQSPTTEASVKAPSSWVGPPVLLRLDPDALRQPRNLIPRHAPLRFADERGTGLPSVLDAIRDRDEVAYAALRDRFLAMFPLVKRLHLRAENETQKSIEVELQNGKSIGANLMSEGMLYFLAFLAAAHAHAAPVLLVEEPENGLHPSRVGEVMDVLREVSKTTQVILATHSPLVVNELSGDDVTIVVRDNVGGVRGTLLKDTPGFEQRAKVYAPGELWVSYANGLDEGPLLQGKPRS